MFIFASVYPRTLSAETVLGLIHRGGDRWLFGGVYRIAGVHAGVRTPFQYETERLPGQNDLAGRVTVKFRREFRASYIWGEKYGDQLEVAEILDAPLAVEKFKGYSNVHLSHSELRMIVQRQEPSWSSALSSMNGVYLIMDKQTGKGYFGSACGGGGIWQRWCAYADARHGGNVELKALLDTKGADYCDDFLYSILEIVDPLASDDQVLRRESHWKDVLLSRAFGYNSN
jgi:hypothetical protein